MSTVYQPETPVSIGRTSAVSNSAGFTKR